MIKFLKRLITPILFLLLGLYILNRSISEPIYNWDMFAYVASAKSFELEDVDSLHAFAFDQVKSFITPEDYELLIKDNSYRYKISTDADAFSETLPFYQIRPLYTGFIYLLYKLGINIVFSTYLISGIAVSLGIIFLYLISSYILKKQYIFTIPFFAIIFSVHNLGRFSTPDGLSFLVVIAIAYLFISKRYNAILILSPLILGIRTDLIIFTLPLLFVLFFIQNKNKSKVAMSIIFSILIYVFIINYWKYPGWSTIYYYSMVERTIFPISLPQLLTVDQYLRTLYYSLTSLLHYKTVIFYILISISSILIIIKKVRGNNSIDDLSKHLYILTGICILYVIAHFLILPLPWVRFFIAQYLIGTIVFLAIIPDYMRRE